MTDNYPTDEEIKEFKIQVETVERTILHGMRTHVLNRDQAKVLLDIGLLAIGMEPDCSMIWQNIDDLNPIAALEYMDDPEGFEMEAQMEAASEGVVH